jgi:hypothetical protein
VKIISDGTIAGTHFLTENGEKIHGVIGFSMHGSGSDNILIAQLVIRVTEIDMHLSDDIVEVVELVRDAVELEILEDWEEIDE